MNERKHGIVFHSFWGMVQSHCIMAFLFCKAFIRTFLVKVKPRTTHISPCVEPIGTSIWLGVILSKITGLAPERAPFILKVLMEGSTQCLLQSLCQSSTALRNWALATHALCVRVRVFSVLNGHIVSTKQGSFSFPQGLGSQHKRSIAVRDMTHLLKLELTTRSGLSKSPHYTWMKELCIYMDWCVEIL